MNGSLLPRAQVPSNVKNKPFEARWECAFGGQDIFSGRLYRNSAGGVRFEIRTSSGEETIVIRDEERGDLNILQPAKREAMREEIGQRPLLKLAFANVIPTFTEERRVIHGVRCQRVTLKDALSKGDAGETWISDDQSMVMSDAGQVEGRFREWQVVELHFREPAAELFVVPQDYRIVRENRE